MGTPLRVGRGTTCQVQRQPVPCTGLPVSALYATSSPHTTWGALGWGSQPAGAGPAVAEELGAWAARCAMGRGFCCTAHTVFRAYNHVTENALARPRGFSLGCVSITGVSFQNILITPEAVPILCSPNPFLTLQDCLLWTSGSSRSPGVLLVLSVVCAAVCGRAHLQRGSIQFCSGLWRHSPWPPTESAVSSSFSPPGGL